MTCSFPGCDKPAKANGLCNAHYVQSRRGTELKPLQKNKTKVARKCKFHNCGMPAMALGLCNKHYLRIYRHKDEQGPPPLANAPDRIIDELNSGEYWQTEPRPLYEFFD